MTIKDAQCELAEVGAILEQAIEQLSQRPTAFDQWTRTLASAAAKLQRTRDLCAESAVSQAIRPLVRCLDTRAKQVQVLLDSAASFYCGCVAVRASQGGGYTPSGTLEPLTGGGRMQLEA
jgi:hypothetical protein